MKIALITDCHWGVRNDHSAFLDNNKQFLDEVFFPTLKEHKIKTVVCLGDLVERRKYINFNTAHRLRKDFIEPLTSYAQFFWILGNHDLYWRNSTDVTVADELNLGDLAVFKNATEMLFDDTKVLFVPWICDSNRKQVMDSINKTDAQICFGHFELAGFEMYKGMVNSDGDDPSLLQKFSLTCSGHYHHKSVSGGIHYLGAMGEHTWSDYGDDRGFHIFDPTTRRLDFITNPFSMFAKVFYDDTRKKDHSQADYSFLKDKIVKVIIKARTNSDAYHNFMVKVEAAQPLELLVVDDHLNLDSLNDESIISETKDTLTIIREFVAQTNNMVNATELDNLIINLYGEAQNLD